MRKVFGCLGAVLLGTGVLSATLASAAGPDSHHPAVSILSPRNSATLRESTLTVKVAVQDFRLVTPTLENPPILKGDAGHIHFLLDGPSHFVPSRDVGTADWHTWKNVSPGRHVITVYLATSQHMPFPGARQDSVTVWLQPAVRAVHRVQGGTGLRGGPISGGGVGMDNTVVDLTIPLVALLLLAAGVALRRSGRRL